MNTETVTEKKIPRTMTKDLLSGVWRLKYLLTNRMGPEGFSGRLLSSYTDPLTGAARHLYDEHGSMQPGYFIDRQTTIFNPETNMIDRNVVDWLCGHPLVGVEQSHTGLSDAYISKKDENPRITLVNLDHEEIVDLEEEDFIDRLVGRIVMDKGQFAIGLQSLRFILSKLGLSYMEAKYLKNSKIEKQKLRHRLKDYIRKGINEANQVVVILDNMAEAKYEYEIKEMVRLEILYIANGMYKYEGNPLGISTESVIKYFMQNPDFYAETNSVLMKKLKSEKGE
jgi:hypothetical protein